MKKIIFILVLMPFLAFGQQNFPLIKDGGVWRVVTISPPDPPLYPGSVFKEQFLMQGDTSFNNTVYKKIYTCDYSPAITNKVFYGGIREDSLQKVYFFLDSNQYFNSLQSNFLKYRQEYLLYDFSLNIGDTLRVVNPQDSILVLNKIDSVIIGNQYRKKWEFRYDFSGTTKVWVEGIGDLNGLFFPLQFDMVDIYHSLTCYEDTTLFWTNPELSQNGTSCFSVGIEAKTSKSSISIKAYPNPVSTIINFEFEKTYNHKMLLEIYDVLGQRIYDISISGNENNIKINLEGFNKGIYFYKWTRNDKIIGTGKFVKE